MNKQPAIPTYEVDFIPLERRLKDRRKNRDSTYSGPERRHGQSRRDDEPVLAKPRRN